MDAQQVSILVSAGSFVLALSLAVIAFFAKDRLLDVKKVVDLTTAHGDRLTKLESTQANARVEALEPRVAAIELGLVEIRGNLGHMAEDVTYVKRWVQSQADPGLKRRRGDGQKG